LLHGAGNDEMLMRPPAIMVCGYDVLWHAEEGVNWHNADNPECRVRRETSLTDFFLKAFIGRSRFLLLERRPHWAGPTNDIEALGCDTDRLSRQIIDIHGI
jgi:hypothetical protein